MAEKIAVSILSEMLNGAHEAFTGTMEGVTNEVAAYQPSGIANPIAGTFAHLVFSEDFFVQGFLKGSKPLFETEWKDRTGISELQPTEWQEAYPKWLKSVTVDMSKAQEYSKAVFKASEDYVATLTDSDLSKEVDMSMFGMGKRPVGSFIGGIIVGHIQSITGEISVLKGIQGLKGYPY